MEDRKIIELYFQRSEEAILETERTYGEKLHGLSLRILENQEDSQECVNDTYMKTWETIPPQRPQFFFAYIAKLCRHFAFGRLDWNRAAKRNARVVTLSDELAQCIPDEKQEQLWRGREIGKVLDGFLAGLNVENRQIFLRRYWYCDTIAEIAKRYDISESKVKTRLHRLRQQLRATLEQEGIQV